MQQPTACPRWCPAICLLTAVLATAGIGAGRAESEDRAPLQIGGRRQLFIDHRFIAQSENISLAVNPPVKRPEPVLASDKPWDAFRLIFFTVAQDGGLCKMWYQAFDNDQWGPQRKSRLCYAVSKDGLRWDKPDLGVNEFGGSKENNIVLDDMFSGCVFIDPHGKPQERFKLIYATNDSIRAGVSADGIRWALPPQDLIKREGIGYDVQSVASWDEGLGKYVVFLRVWVTGEGKPAFPFVEPTESNPPAQAPKLMRPVRAIGRLEMDDILAPWPADAIRTVLVADEMDPPDSDLYLPFACRYPFAADAWFMFPLTYQHFRGDETDVGNDGANDVQFAASRDGRHWMRYGREAYLRRGLPGEPDAGMAQATPCLVRQGNYLYHYYSTWPWTHGGFRRLSAQERQVKNKSWGKAFYHVAIQRLDGFVSANAPFSGGWLVTPPIIFQGKRLELNIDVAAMGEARVELQDAAGKAISGFTLDGCRRILANDVAHTVRWGQNADVAGLAGKPVRLKIAMRAARLYAFQFVGE